MKSITRGLGIRLSDACPGVRLPYDRAQITSGIVHLGIGAFHRAHMAAYVDDVLQVDPSWGIVGASFRRPDTRNALAPQDFLYVLVLRSASGTATRVVGSVIDVLVAAGQSSGLIAAMTDPCTRIVSLTITEKGYCHDPATGTLNPDHPDVRHDLAHPDLPVSAPGLIVRALDLRRAADIPPFTVLCCDNLQSNGATTARVIVGFAALRDKRLADYIARHVAFPSTMVDRIVPATTDADRAQVFEETGLIDAWPVVTEPFSQWVIEDRFPTGRPPLETAGVTFVADVRPFELMKLRMLNGSHSLIAYLGYLNGYKYVGEAISNPAFRGFIYDFMTYEVMSTLPAACGNLAAYRDALLDRFSNPALLHQTWQIAMDGSQKLPQRLLSTIRDRLSRGQMAARAVLGVAAWMRYVIGVDERGHEIDVRDPLAGTIRTVIGSTAGDPTRIVDGLLKISEIFGNDLPQDESFRAMLVRFLRSLISRGALKSIQDFVSVHQASS